MALVKLVLVIAFLLFLWRFIVKRIRARSAARVANTKSASPTAQVPVHQAPADADQLQEILKPRGWLPESARPRVDSELSSAEPITRKTKHVTGDVRNFEARQDIANGPMTWRFTLERHNAETGGRLQSVDVEMRGITKGVLSNDSRVTVFGGTDANGLFVATKIANHSSGSVTSPSRGLKVFQAIFLLIFSIISLGILAVFAAFLFHH
jgi:hypothetical protein